MKQLIERAPDFVIQVLMEDDAEMLRAEVWYTDHGTYVHVTSEGAIGSGTHRTIERVFDEVAQAILRIAQPDINKPSSTLVPVTRHKLPF